MFPAKVVARRRRRDDCLPGRESRADALALASELRAEALRVDVYPEASRKLDKPLKYAVGRERAGAGDSRRDERARGEVTVRDLQTREQDSVPRASGAPAAIARARSASSQNR